MAINKTTTTLKMNSKSKRSNVTDIGNLTMEFLIYEMIETVYKVKTSKWLNKFSHKLPEALFIHFIPQYSTPKIKLRHDLNKDEDPDIFKTRIALLNNTHKKGKEP